MHLWGQKYHRGSPYFLCSYLYFTWIHTSVPFQFHPAGPKCSHAHQKVPRGDFFELKGEPMAWMGAPSFFALIGCFVSREEGFGNRTASSLWLQVTRAGPGRPEPTCQTFLPGQGGPLPPGVFSLDNWALATGLLFRLREE